MFVDRADAVGIAVESDAKFSAGFADFGDQVRQVGGHGWIGVMVGKVAVHVEEKFGGVQVDLFKYAMDDRARRAVARIGHNLDAAFETKLRGDLVDVGRDGVGSGQRAAARIRNRRAG